MSTAMDRILARFPNARRVGGGHIADCPAHDDRSPSLSIREGREGVLLHCFAGCSVPAIVAALGLCMADLFDESKTREMLATPRRAPTAKEVEAALREHIARILDEERQRLGYTPPTTSRHHNRARTAVNRILGTSLKPIASAWWEHAQYDSDPLWKTLAQRALLEIVTKREHAEPTREDYIDAEERAGEWLRSEARRIIIKHSTREVA